MRRIVIQWPRFGPYHLARLEATGRRLRTEGVEVVGLETAGTERLYGWRRTEGADAFRRVQVFPDATYEDLAAEQIHRGVTAALDRLQPEAVAITSYSQPDARACLTWCRRRGRTAIVMTASRAEDAPRAAWREALKRVIVREFDAGLVGGAAHRPYLRSLGVPGPAIFTPYNAVDNAFYAARADEARRHPERVRHLPGLDDQAPFFLCVSRFIHRKNLPGLLRAYARYRAGAEAPWRLILAGDGPLRPALEAQIRDERIGGVVLPGFRQIEEVAAYYGRAGAFVHPADADQWGLAVNEAMAAGLPVLVSTGAGCARDLVEEGVNGFTFPPDDLEVLAWRMADLAASATDRDAMGRRSRTIIEAWSPEAFADGLWRAIAAGHERPPRPFHPLARLALRLLRLLGRRHRALHHVEA